MPFSCIDQSKIQHKSDCFTALGACLTASDTFWASLLAAVASLIRSGSLNPLGIKQKRQYEYLHHLPSSYIYPSPSGGGYG